jgi:hypothetical protein
MAIHLLFGAVSLFGAFVLFFEIKTSFLLAMSGPYILLNIVLFFGEVSH